LRRRHDYDDDDEVGTQDGQGKEVDTLMTALAKEVHELFF